MATETSEPPRAEDYRVAWISAIDTEHRVACQMLDEVFEPPLLLSEDGRCYTFGRMHGHKVVLARLPEKRVGTVEAAKLASDMNRTFTLLRIGFMVGIAGGACSHDIRLGDVVVSAPDDKKRSPGVLHYGFGASVQGEGFKIRSTLDGPPAELLSAISQLKTEYFQNGKQLGRQIQLALDQHPAIMNDYGRPQPSTDILYESSFIHPDETKTCVELGCVEQTSRQVERAPRPVDSEQSIVRHGTIASADVLVRDAVLRDKLASEDGVLCFEMESAGLMNMWPRWMIFRGICDYADTHKNKSWQNYAALAAAVYAKDVLRIAPTWTDSNRGPNMTRKNSVAKAKTDVLELLRYDNMDNKKRFSGMQKGYNVDWIWDTPFELWLQTSDLPFWIRGKPGSGKSTLVAHLVNEKRTITNLQSEGETFKILHFFYDHRAGEAVANTPQGMLRMLLFQLADQFSDIKNRLQDLVKRQQLKLDSVEGLIDTVCDAITRSRSNFCIFVDGLDEYKGDVFDLIDICDKIKTRTGVKFCVASREDERIAESIVFGGQISMQDHNEQSMLAYAEAKLTEHQRTHLKIKQHFDLELRKEIVDKAEGIILWFKLVFDKVLREYQAHGSSIQVHDFVREIPPGLESIYERLLDAIDPHNRAEAAFVLYLVMQLSDIMRLVDFSTSSFDYLWGLYDFIIAQSAVSLPFERLDNPQELQSHIKLLLPGVVETAKPDGLSKLEIVSWLPPSMLNAGIQTFLDVRFVHGTFLQYLKDIDWVQTYMPSDIKERYYAKDFWPRIFTDVFKRTEADNLIDETIVRECVREIGLIRGTFGDFTWTRFTSLTALTFSPRQSYFWAIMLQLFPCTWQGLVDIAEDDNQALKVTKRSLSWIIDRCSSLIPFPPQWKSWHALLRLSLGIFVEKAKEHEMSGGSVHPLVFPALQSHFVMIAAGKKFETPLPEWLFTELIDKRNDPDTRDVITAIVCDLPSYFTECLAANKLSVTQQQDVLRAVISWSIYTEASTSTVTSFTKPICDAGIRLTYEDLRLFLLNSTCLAQAVAQTSALRPLLRTASSVDGRSKDPAMNNLLMYWVQFSCFEHEERSNDELITKAFLELLDLILDAGADIESESCNGITAMQAVIDKTISRLPGRSHTYRKAKFHALVRRGAKFPQSVTRKKRSLRRMWKTSAADTDYIQKSLDIAMEDGKEWEKTLKKLEAADNVQDVHTKLVKRSWLSDLTNTDLPVARYFR